MRRTSIDSNINPTSETGCVHHWIIDSPEGATSQGVCKACGAKNEFSNFLPLPAWIDTKSSLNTTRSVLTEDIGSIPSY